MSRSCADEHNIRQHRSRLLQLAEGSGKSASVSSKRRSYSSHHALFKSLQQMTPSPRIATKLLSLEEVVRNDPGYTPNIEHLVFPARKNSNTGSNIPVLSNKAGKQSARSRLAEVFTLNKHQQSRNKASSQQQSPVSNSATPSENSRSQTESNRSSQRKSIKEGSGGVEPVAEDSSSTPAVPDGSTTSQCSAVSEELDNMASRGPNVSILHLRSTSEPWETGPSMTYSNTSSTRSGRTTVTMTSGSKYAGRSNGRREPATNSGLAVGSSVSGDCSRELSPVRWCDREVDGVYLGRSGWVQVQQRSLDENRRIHFPISKQQSSGACSPSAPPRIKMSDYHCSKSEPGKFPEVLRLDETNQQRPGYLPLPNDNRRTKDKISPSSLDLEHEDPMTPPPVTPIISPPPAFQDTNRRFLNTSTAPRPRSISSKPPFLSRSNAVEVSPPPSPPPAIPWATLPTQRISPGTNPMARPRRLTPSPISTPQQHSIPQTKSLEDTTGNRRSIFQKYDSSSSSSSSFGFRSLDSNLSGRGIGMPRLTETDSSLGGYEDGDEDDNLSSSLNLSGYSSVTVVNSSPDTAALHSVIPSGERVSPSSLRQGRQHHRQMRRSPGSDGSNKKLGSNNCSPSSSSSSSSSRSPSAAPFRRSASHNNPRQLHHQRENSATWDGRNNRVRRSRSLQLPERRSPSAASCTSRTEQVHNNDHQYYHSKVEPTRVVVKINGEQPRPKRHVMQQRQSEDIQRDREREREEELRREAEEEARVVTEFLYGARSRDAARALIMQRCLERSTTPQDPSGMFNVVFVNNNRGTSRSTNQQRPRMLQRGATTPALGSKSSSPVGNNVFCPNPCNPTTCDFWPHCAHRDGIYTTTKASTPTVMSPVPPSTLRLSQSYPNNANNKDRKTKRENGRNGYQSTRSSPASLERVNEHDISPNRHYPKRGNSLNVPSPTTDVDWRNVGPQCRQHSHLPMREKPQVGQHPIGLKVGLSDTSSSTGSSMDVVEPDRYRRDDSVYRGGVLVSCAVSPDPSKVSPIEVNSVIVNTGGSSASSTSSDIWVTTSDRTMTKSPRNQKSSGASTPLEDAIALSKSPVKESDEDNSRPGSAPAQQEDRRFLDTQQRSLSLPKSFQAGREAVQHRQSGLFPWSRRIDPPRSTMHSPAPTLRPPTPETARTAPATPVREMGLETDRQPNGSISSGLAKTSRFSSTPLLDPPNTEWEINRPWPQAQKDHQRLPDKDISQSQRNISGNSAESVLQKFRKSFSLRFYKKGGGNSKDEEEETEQLPPDSPPRNHTPPPLVKEDSLEKFRFGPLVWRTSKERKKGKKAARNAKCNSGDSGIQIEMVGRTGGDSSESHDTDHLADDEPLDETDSPPVIRRRGTTSSSDGKPSRPTSDVINQILIDKLKADLQARSIPRRGGHQHVRRTHSDLGGQRLFNWDVRNSYRRMFSSPSPIKMKPHLSPRKTALDTPLRNSKRFSNRPQQLRRSISQPLGINELSPLLRRKPSAGGRSHVLSEDERGATSDDEMMSDSESSVASLTDRKKSFEQAMDEEVVILAEAVWDHVAMETEELAFRAGDVIEVLDTLDRDWWWGARGDQSGWFPSAFVRLRVSQEDTVEDCLAAMASGGSKQLRRRTSISLLSNDQVRSRVVRELINTERDFVKVLRDVAEGYLAECRRRTDMFSDEQIETIFGNLEQLLEFQSQFLEDLERNVEWDAPHRSCIGDTFLLHQGGFRMYSEYCNSHPMAIATLQELYQHNNYSKFFEACRLMRGLIEIPLDGYLLTPVQRICKYPLQLAELLKYTKPDHPDHEKITKALEAMRGVAVLINERKRRMESLEKLAAWQQRVEGWEGEDLIETSSQLIYQGEAVRVTSGMWTNNIILFLFDHQLIYCKKDILKRNTYVYKGRIQMDTSEVINLTDGKEPQLGVSVRHGIKIYSCVRDKWLLFCCRTAQEKSRWLESFAQERRMVAQDLRDGLEFAPAARHLARMAAARCYRRPPSKPRSKNYKRGNSDVTVTDGTGIGSNGLNNAPVHISSHHSLGRRMGTWFTFGSNKKGRGLGRAATLQTVVHPS